MVRVASAASCFVTHPNWPWLIGLLSNKSRKQRKVKTAQTKSETQISNTNTFLPLPGFGPPEGSHDWKSLSQEEVAKTVEYRHR